MARPKGAGNRRYREENVKLAIKMAELIAQDPWDGLSIWKVARSVAPEAQDFDGDATHRGKVPRRLYAFYKCYEQQLKELVHARLYPPPPYT
jgi:hypothetical protein